MLIAHGPAGYLIGVLAARVKQRTDLVVAGLIGGLLPDLDAVGYHLGLVQGFHRATPFHWPTTWLVITLIGLLLIMLRRKPGEFITVIGIAALIHCGLDMTMAPLYWAAPFHWETYEMVHVPGGWSPYWLGFIFYWTFLVEVALIFAALFVWHTRREQAKTLCSSQCR